MLFTSSPPILMDSLLFQLFHFPCFCSDWWVQGWYFSCHSTLISYLHGGHWKRLLKSSKLSDILKSHLLFPGLTKPKGSLPSSRTAPSPAPAQVCCHFPLLLTWCGHPHLSCSSHGFLCGLYQNMTFDDTIVGFSMLLSISPTEIYTPWRQVLSPGHHCNFSATHEMYTPHIFLF